MKSKLILLLLTILISCSPLYDDTSIKQQLQKIDSLLIVQKTKIDSFNILLSKLSKKEYILTWDANPRADGYNIYQVVPLVGTETGASWPVTRKYYVTAFNQAGESLPSDTVEIK